MSCSASPKVAGALDADLPNCSPARVNLLNDVKVSEINSAPQQQSLGQTQYATHVVDTHSAKLGITPSESANRQRIFQYGDVTPATSLQ